MDVGPLRRRHPIIFEAYLALGASRPARRRLVSMPAAFRRQDNRQRVDAKHLA